MLTITLQYTHILNQYAVHLNLITLSVKCISIKKNHMSENLKKENLDVFEIAIIFDTGRYVLASLLVFNKLKSQPILSM